MPLIGTAGHVDHGKSTLIEALTGRDPDRWEEEKRRGLTIDLGFAWLTFPNGAEASFVDVPGHERYLKNMLAGIEAIDVALFVVAADEGWMPQSEEHLAVLDLLGIDTGVVAVTKIDTVDADLVELATLEIAEHLAGTTLEHAEVIPVSSVTGEGIDVLGRSLAALISKVEPAGNRPRLWVDRSFSVAGAGTVVTGTLIEGPLETGTTVEVYPGNQRARVRGLQSHESEVIRAEPGRRLALNLTGLDRAEIRRGAMVGLPGQWDLTKRFTARVRSARYAGDLSTRGSFHLHFGSGAHPVSVVRLDDGFALLQTTTALPMQSGDRFILRDTGRRLVVAGGEVLDPAPGRTGVALRLARSIRPEAGPDAVATSLLSARGIDDLARLEAHSGGGRPGDAVVIGSSAITETRFAEMTERAVEMVTAHHHTHPLREGLPLATMATRLEVSQEVASHLVDATPALQRRGPDVAAANHQQRWDGETEARWHEVEEMLGRDLAVPNAADLGIDEELLHLLIRTGRLIRISDQLVFLPSQVEAIVAALKEMDDGFTVAEFRDRTGLSRKYAVPLLEWADKEGLTIRQGEIRRLR